MLFHRDLCYLLSNAKLAPDKYHWVRQVILAIEKVRKQVQKTFPKNKRLHFKRNKYILLALRERLNIEDGIERIFGRKGADVVELNIKALRAGRAVAENK